ncbi:MAG: hypothetical protein JWL97_3928, partial [Gemmatimonadales bacterium]|nr:hypothetical protein [Gemmatimonadales bacterium]
MAVVAEVAGELVGGRYRLIEPVGQGGMGRVWRGRDEILHREVAVKEILLPHGLVSKERDVLFRRVMREARSAARLNHPGIITIHDITEHNGAPLIVMEFIAGRSLAAVIREEGRLPPRRVAAIGAAMLDALQEAHAAGIVHRDLKPDNVLITGRRTVITDFGIASMADATALTSPGAKLGTPLYMAPEQIEGKPATPASDLWSLGATLYAAVEGQTPFTGPTIPALFNAIFSKAPRPAEHAGPLRPILVALLDKDPGQRTTADQTAQSLAALLEPPAGGPETPTPETPAYEATLTGHTDMVCSVAFSPDGKTLATGSKDTAVRLWDVGGRTSIATLTGHTGTVYSVAFSPDGKTLATGSKDTTVRLWDVASRTHIATLTGHTDMVCSVAFSPDGKTLATGSTDNKARLWDVGARTSIATLTGHTGTVYSVAFSPDGKTLATGSTDTAVRLWDVGGRTNIATLTGHPGPVYSVAFSPDGKTLATGSYDTAVRLWDVGGRTSITTLTGHTHFLFSVAFSPDGEILASGSWDKTVRLWKVTGHTAQSFATLLEPSTAGPNQPDPTTLSPTGPARTRFLTGHTAQSFSPLLEPPPAWPIQPDPKTLPLTNPPQTHPGSRPSTPGPLAATAVSAAPRPARRTVRCEATLTGHTHAIFSVACSPDGKTLAT